MLEFKGWQIPLPVGFTLAAKDDMKADTRRFGNFIENRYSIRNRLVGNKCDFLDHGFLHPAAVYISVFVRRVWHSGFAFFNVGRRHKNFQVRPHPLLFQR
jgi:hypothetical protein